VADFGLDIQGIEEFSVFDLAFFVANIIKQQGSHK
jgi:hypothetical protein